MARRLRQRESGRVDGAGVGGNRGHGVGAEPVSGGRRAAAGRRAALQRSVVNIGQLECSMRPILLLAIATIGLGCSHAGAPRSPDWGTRGAVSVGQAWSDATATA